MRPIWLVLLAACGSSTAARTQDAGPGSDSPPPPDAPAGNAACGELAAAPITVPAHVTGAIAGADLQAPATCATVDAPYGILSGGPDSVVELAGLAVGTSYVVHLASATDLSFYVVTGCSTSSGPSASECQLFEDASTSGDELGTFVATATTMYVVVDSYATTPPADPSFTLDVYPEQCASDAVCPANLPACVNGHCVACETSFDCTSPARPRCDDSHACVAGDNSCLADDPAEPGDDGPAGASVLVPDSTGYAQLTEHVCSSPSSEADYVAFDVTSVGDTWDLALGWSGSRILHLDVYDARGTAYGLSYWEQPQRVRLTYLAPGRYYAVVTEVEPTGDQTPVAYTLAAQRTPGAGCTSSVDCAAEYRNQLYRGDCVAGSCVHDAAAGQGAELSACDRVADCASGLSCASFFFVANADTRDVCARACGSDGDCAALGANYTCTTYLAQNFCVQKCTSSAQCPVATDTQPQLGPWYRLSCDVASGRCLP
ncbi:MAG: hypothetical protein ACM31C_02645 [Acidobacteriota bacterium]